MNTLLELIFDPEIFLATNPPLFYVGARLLGLLGIGEAWLRLLSLACGLVTVLLTRRLALVLGLERAQALLAAALVACSPLAIEYSTDFSHYALVTAMVTLSFTLLLRALRTHRTGCWHGYFTLMVVGFYTHYIFLVLGMAHVLYVLGFCWQNRRSGGGRCATDFVRRGLVASMFVLPWLPVFFFSVDFGGLLKETTSHYYAQAPSLGIWLWDMIRALAGLTPRLGVLAMIPLGLWLLGVGLHRRSSNQGRMLLVLPPAMLLVHVVSMYYTMTSFLEGGAYYPFRYGLAVVPLLAVPVALALHHTVTKAVDSAARLPARGLAMAALLLATSWLAGATSHVVRQAREEQRPDLAAAAELLRAELRHGDAVVVSPAFSQAQALTWYLRGEVAADVVGVRWRPLPSGEPGWYYGPLADISFHPVQMELAPGRFQRVFVVSVGEGHADRPKFDHTRILEHLLTSLASSYQLDATHSVPWVTIHELRPTTEPAQTSFPGLLAQAAMEEW